MQILSLFMGVNALGVIPNNATLTQITVVSAAGNTRGIGVYSGAVVTEDLPDADAGVYCNGTYLMRAQRGSNDRLGIAVFIPAGFDLFYATCRSSLVRLSYTVF